MRKHFWVLMTIVILGSVLLAACGGGGAATEEAKPVPAEYAGKTNPLSSDQAAAGKEVYDLFCASCHGDTGKGDGPAGASLDPKPADLSTQQANLSDDFLYWVIAEGGAAAGLSPSMAAYKDVLTEDEIWKSITYIRSLK